MNHNTVSVRLIGIEDPNADGNNFIKIVKEFDQSDSFNDYKSIVTDIVTDEIVIEVLPNRLNNLLSKCRACLIETEVLDDEEIAEEEEIGGHRPRRSEW